MVMSYQSCFCGCDTFRFKKHNIPSDDHRIYYNQCSNCNHQLADHVNIIRSKQAE